MLILIFFIILLIIALSLEAKEQQKQVELSYQLKAVKILRTLKNDFGFNTSEAEERLLRDMLTQIIKEDNIIK